MALVRLDPIDAAIHKKYSLRGRETLNQLTEILEERSLNPESIEFVNQQITRLNGLQQERQAYYLQLQKTNYPLLRHLEKHYGWVPKGHNTTRWLTVGMSIFGIPIGVSIGLLADNMALLGIGFGLGMLVGLLVGYQKDQ